MGKYFTILFLHQGFQLPYQKKFLKRMELHHATKIQSDNIWTKMFQTDGWEGQNDSVARSIFSLLRIWNPFSKLFEKPSTPRGTADYSWSQDKKSVMGLQVLQIKHSKTWYNTPESDCSLSFAKMEIQFSFETLSHWRNLRVEAFICVISHWKWVLF